MTIDILETINRSNTLKVRQVLSDREFYELPLEERRKVLSTLDPDFAGLDVVEQNKVIYREAPPAMRVDTVTELLKPENFSPEFIDEIKNDVMFANAIDTDSLLLAHELRKRQETTPIFKKAGMNILAGLGGLFENTAGFLKRKTEGIGIPGLDTFLGYFEDEGRRLKESMYVPMVNPHEFTWGDMFSADWWASSVMPAVPAGLSLIPVALVGRGLGLGAVAGAVRAGLTMGKFAQTVMASVGAGALSRVVESALESQDTYNSLRSKGYTKEEAEVAADKVFKDNLKLAFLDIGEFLSAFAPIKFRNSSKALRMAAALGLKPLEVAGLEGLEERLQEFIQLKAEQPDTPYSEFFNLDNTPENEATAIGALFGIGLGGYGSVHPLFNQEVIGYIKKNGTPELVKTFNDAVKEAGNDYALEKVANTTEGQKLITDAVNELKRKATATAGGVIQPAKPIETESQQATTGGESEPIPPVITDEEINNVVETAIARAATAGGETTATAEGETAATAGGETAKPQATTGGETATAEPIETKSQQTAAAVKPARRPKILGSPVIKMIREDTALKAVFKKSVKFAREAYKAGKMEGVEIEKAKLKRYLHRARVLKEVQKQFQLTDAEFHRITGRKNPLLLEDIEWKQFLDKVRNETAKLYEMKNLRHQYYDLVNTKNFKKVDNLRKALKLPTIENMTAVQLQEYINLLSQYQTDDEFLSVRKLQTIDNTDLAGLKTVREIKERLAREVKAPIEDIEKTANWLTESTYDAMLRQNDPFLKLLVDGVNRELIDGDASYYQFRNEMESLAKASKEALAKTMPELSHDHAVIDYLEAEPDEKAKFNKVYPKATLDYLQYLEEYFADAYEYLVKHNELTGSRFEGKYYPHMRRGFWETLFDAKDGGVRQAVQELFDRFNQDRKTFEILEEQTGDILPLQKFFSNVLWRSGGLIPTKNSARAILNYAQRFERKKALDRIIPKFVTYAQVLAPEGKTRWGLKLNTSLERFVKTYINTKKGRYKDVLIFKQGNTPDMILRGIKSFTSLMDLGFNFLVQIPASAGETIANYIQMGEQAFIKGNVRKHTAKGKRIIEKYRHFVGDSIFREFTGIEKTFLDKVYGIMFGLFHNSMTEANKTFLLGMMNDVEYETETISPERLAELKGEMGRFRFVEGGRSVLGSTSVGRAWSQYRSWAIPIATQIIKDINVMVKTLQSKGVTEMLSLRETKEIVRILAGSMLIYMVLGMLISDSLEKSRRNRTVLDEFLIRTYQDGLSMIGALDPTLLFRPPRTMQFLYELGANLNKLTKEFDASGLGKQFTPRVFKQGINP